MAERKLTRKEVLAPDEFVKDAGLALSWADRHRRELLAGVGAAVGLAVVWFAVAAAMDRSREKAGAAYAKVQSAAEAAEADAKDPGKVDAAATALQALKEAHGNSDAARLGAYRVGALKADRGDWAGAAPLLEEAAKAGGARGSLARFRLAGALEAQSKWDEALANYRAAGEDARSPVREAARLGAARVLDLKGDKDGARKAYARFAEDFPDSPRAAEAKERAAGVSAP